MTYIEQLKAKYSTPEKAYKHYCLSKTLLHHIVISDNSPQEIKDILDVQKNLTDYSENFIENEHYKELHNFFGFSEKQQLIDFMSKDQNFEKLHFLEIKYEFRKLVLNGQYQKKILEESQNITWNSLETLIIKENNNNPRIENSNLINEKLNKIVKDFGLSTLTLANVKADEKFIDRIYNSLEQLAIVLDIDKKHVGLNKMNLCIDNGNDMDLYSGAISRFKSKHLTFYINSQLMDEVIAHEWFHFLDVATAEQKYLHIYGDDIDKYRLLESKVNSSFTELSKKMQSNNNDLSVRFNKDEIYVSIEKTIDKYSLLNRIKNTKQLKEFIKAELKKNDFNSEEFIEQLKKFQMDKDTSFISYVLADINMLKYDFKSDKSVFSYYSESMDNYMKKAGLLHVDDCYSMDICEIFARTFESYADYKLKEKHIPNIISNPHYFHSPQERELKLYINDFKEIIDNMKQYFNLICPISNKDVIVEKILNSRIMKDVPKNPSNKIVKSQG